MLTSRKSEIWRKNARNTLTTSVKKTRNDSDDDLGKAINTSILAYAKGKGYTVEK
ncbi:MAG: hypothetical protein LBU22_04180 [Dysgonamonadaceae bacterium]|nr:hypothetical protein [Dysgonamonadaceae bacterium]